MVPPEVPVQGGFLPTPIVTKVASQGLLVSMDTHVVVEVMFAFECFVTAWPGTGFEVDAAVLPPLVTAEITLLHTQPTDLTTNQRRLVNGRNVLL